MTPVAIIEGEAVALLRANLDTDQIIPARFLRKPRAGGYGGFLFHDLRGEEPGLAFGLIPGRAPRILVTGANFGCGSSREGAVYALMDAGVGCVIAAGFGDIFAGNARRNGLLLIRLAEADVAVIQAMLPGRVLVDLPAQRLHLPDQSVLGFEIDPFVKRCLVEGLDDIGVTLAHADAITEFVRDDAVLRPWAAPG